MMERYRAPTRRAPAVSNHVMCYIKFIPRISIEGGAVTSAKCVEQLYIGDNLDGREIPVDGKVLARFSDDASQVVDVLKGGGGVAIRTGCGGRWISSA